MQITTPQGRHKVLRNLPGQRIGAKAWYEHIRNHLVEEQGDSVLWKRKYEVVEEEALVKPGRLRQGFKQRSSIFLLSSDQYEMVQFKTALRSCCIQ